MHWNFFFTLAATGALDVLLETTSLANRSIAPEMLAVFAACGESGFPERSATWLELMNGGDQVQQIQLARFGRDWVLSPARCGLLDQNKEGVASLAGACSIKMPSHRRDTDSATRLHARRIRLNFPLKSCDRLSLVGQQAFHLLCAVCCRLLGALRRTRRPRGACVEANGKSRAPANSVFSPR